MPGLLAARLARQGGIQTVLETRGCRGPTPTPNPGPLPRRTLSSLFSGPEGLLSWGRGLRGEGLRPPPPWLVLSSPPIPADIYDKVSGEIQKKGYDCECLGGGRISHQSQDRKIHVYGYSMVSPQLGTPVLAGEHPALLADITLPPGTAASQFPRGMTQET